MVKKIVNHLLIVDDNKTSNFLLEHYLEGITSIEKVTFVDSALEAQRVFISDNQNLPDLVLLDINMPELDGFDFLDWYENGGLAGKTKFAMYSTSIRLEDKKRALSYGDVIDYVEKPLDDKKLETLFASFKIALH